MALRTIGVKLTANITDYNAKMRAAAATTKGFSKELGKAASGGHLDKLGSAAGGMGFALGGAFAYAVKAAADFDKQMSGVAAATHAGTAEMAALRAAALQAGKDTQYSATEAANGITELSKAGISTSQILNGGLKGALTLAAAGQLGVAEAAETAASAMTQFKLTGDKVPHVADLLAAAAGKAQGSVHDMGYALNQSGLVASQFGLSIEDTTGVLAEFANAGLIGSDAGTSFKTMLLAIANPSKVTARQMQELNISFYDAQGKFIGLSGVAQELQSKLGDLTQEQRNQALGQIFGNDAIRAATVLYKDGAKGVEDWKGKVNESGYAAQTAQTQTNNLAGDIERLKGSFETLAIQGGSGPNSGLRILVKTIDSLVTAFSNMPPAVTTTLTVLAGIGAAAGLGLAGFVRIRKGLASIVTELEAMGPAGAKAATGLSRVAGIAGTAMVAFAAFEAADMIVGHFVHTAADVDKLTDSLANFANTGKVTGEAAAKFGGDLSGLNTDASVLNSAMAKTVYEGNKMVPVLGGFLNNVTDIGAQLANKEGYDTAAQNFKNLDESFTTYMATTKDAGKAQAVWAEILSKSGLDATRLAELMPNAYKQLGVLNDAAMKGKDAQNAHAKAIKSSGAALTDQLAALKLSVDANGNYKTAADAAAAAAVGEADAMKQLSKLEHEQADPVFALIQGERDLKKARDDASAAVKKYGKNSEQARDATNKLAGVALDLQGTIGSLGQDFNGKLSPALLRTLEASGLTKAQIKILSGEFDNAKKAADKYNGKYKADVSAPGAGASKKQIDAAIDSTLKYDGKYHANLDAPGNEKAKKAIDDAWNAANHFNGTYHANMDTPGAANAKQAAADAWAQAKGFEGKYNAALSITGDKKVSAALADLMIKQRALQTGLTYTSARSAIQKDLDRNRQMAYDAGGWTGPGSKYQPAGVVHADEFVVRKESRQKFEAKNPGYLDHLNRTGELPGYAQGGTVQMKFNTTAAKTKVPTLAEALAVVQPSIPSGGQTYPWILSVVKAAFPGLKAISTFREGARTLTGNRSYHAIGDAVDFPASHDLAQFWHDKYGRYTNELITPWNNLNIWKGKAHQYTGAVWNQHNFAGGNAHDHIAITGSLGSPGGALSGSSVGGSLGAWIARGEGVTGTPGSWTSPLNTLIQRESGGNPNAINRTDSNARAGHPSQGLMQLIPATFSHYRLKSLANNILDPVANIAAGIQYIKSRYGSIFNVQQANPNKPPKGYGSGGIVGHTAMAGGGVIGEPVFGIGNSGRTYSFGERGPETVIPGYASGGLVNVATSTGGTSVVRGTRLETVDAMLHAKDAIDSMSAALKENGRSFSQNTVKGRANINTMLDTARAAQDAAKAKYSETGSLSQANRVYADYIAQLDTTLKKMKLTTAQRKALLAAYSEKPKYDVPEAAPPGNSSAYVAMGQARVSASASADDMKKAFAWTKPSFVTTTEQGRAEFGTLFSFLGAAEAAAQTEYQLSGSSKAGMSVYNTYIDQLRATLLKSGMSKAQIDKLLQQYGRITLSKNRWGGLYEHAANGMLTDATVASAGTQYAWAEPNTGGELFAPKYGNLTKTRAQVGWAVQNWWGGNVAWGAAGGGTGKTMVINATIPITLGTEQITQQVRMEVDTAIGQVVNATVYQTS